MKKLFTKLKSTGIIAAVGVILLGAGGTALAATQSIQSNGNQAFQAVLTPLNGTNATALATASVDSKGAGHFHIAVTGLINAPHAQHVHFGVTAAHECPTKAADVNGDGTVDTTEGGPSYGPVQTSLTTNGDTSPASTLAVTRYPTYANGAEYDRTFQLTPDQAQQIRSGLSVVVIHGIDTIMPDGKYDGAAMSELDPTLPQEATAPSSCGVLHEVTTASSVSSNGSSNNNGSSLSNGASKGMAYIALALGGVALVVALISLMRRPVIRQ